mmetsp:Transcript_90448/g.258773  ORF Transcript_90448/g.258773 Transcript_90448/m.258773 type:complete len:255 (-) Transcript_90448:81-845(-)
MRPPAARPMRWQFFGLPFAVLPPLVELATGEEPPATWSVCSRDVRFQEDLDGVDVLALLQKSDFQRLSALLRPLGPTSAVAAAAAGSAVSASAPASAAVLAAATAAARRRGPSSEEEAVVTGEARAEAAAGEGMLRKQVEGVQEDARVSDPKQMVQQGEDELAKSVVTGVTVQDVARLVSAAWRALSARIVWSWRPEDAPGLPEEGGLSALRLSIRDITAVLLAGVMVSMLLSRALGVPCSDEVAAPKAFHRAL